MVEPTCIYADRSAKLTVLPCVQCGDFVNGFRQCMYCFGHLHRQCGSNSKKGSLRSTHAVCASCGPAKNVEGEHIPTQIITLYENDSFDGMIAKNGDALYGDNGEGAMPTQDMATNYPELMAGSASTHVSTSTSSDNLATSIYTSEDRNLRRRLFPCPICGENADGSHQCGVCFRHAHVMPSVLHHSLGQERALDSNYYALNVHFCMVLDLQTRHHHLHQMRTTTISCWVALPQ
jgi:hypothetical protein